MNTERLKNIQQARSENSRPSAEAKERIAKDYLSDVEQIAERFVQDGVDFDKDELVSEGYLALVSEIDRVQPDQVKNFKKYVLQRVYEQMKKYILSHKLDLVTERDLGTIPADEQSTPEQAAHLQSASRRILGMLNKMTTQERTHALPAVSPKKMNIYLRSKINGETLKALASEHSVSTHTIVRYINEVQERINRTMSTYDKDDFLPGK